MTEVAGEPRGATRVAVAAILAQPLVWAGMGRRYPWALFGLEGAARVVWGGVAVLLLVGGLRLSRILSARRAVVARWAVVLLLACPPLTAVYDVLASWHFARFGYGRPWALVALEALVLAAVALWLRSGRAPGTGVALAAAAAALHRVLAASLFPLDERRSDMLAAILRAVDVWRAGGAPYADSPPPGLKYLPGTWLAHAPAASLGVDPRVAGALLLLLVGLGLAASLRGGPRRPAAEPGSLAELLAMLVFLNPYHAFRHDLYFDAFLALTAAIFFAAAREARTWTALAGVAALTGLAAATRQWAWVYGPFALLAAAGRAQWGRLTGGAAIAASVAALLAIPFLVQDREAFLRSVFAFSGESFSEACLGVAGLAAALGATALLPFLQAAICAGSFLRSLSRWARDLATPESILAAGWFTWCAVVLLNPFLENYFYLSPAFAAAAFATSRRA